MATPYYVGTNFGTHPYLDRPTGTYGDRSPVTIEENSIGWSGVRLRAIVCIESRLV